MQAISKALHGHMKDSDALSQYFDDILREFPGAAQVKLVEELIADKDKLCKTLTRQRFTCEKTATGLAESLNATLKRGKQSILKTLNLFELMATLTAWEDEHRLKTLKALKEEVTRKDFEEKPWSAFVHDHWLASMERSCQEVVRVEYVHTTRLDGFKVTRNHPQGT